MQINILLKTLKSLFKTRNEGNKYVVKFQTKGIGVRTFNKKRILKKFFQWKTGDIHNVKKGQGLGLSYVKQIIELHGGQVLVESTKGKGELLYCKITHILNNEKSQ